MNLSAFDRHATERPRPRGVPRAGLQLPDDRHPGRGRAGAAGPPRRRSSPSGAPAARRYHERAGRAAGRAAASPTRLRHHQLPVVLDRAARRLPGDARRVLASLERAGVSARRGIMAAHLEPAYAGPAMPSLPVTERLTRQSLILPLFHGMTEGEQDRVVSVLADAAGLRHVSPPRQQLVLVGAGGLGRETAELVRAINAATPRWDLLGFLDDDPRLEGAAVAGLPVLGPIDLALTMGAAVAICTARPAVGCSRRALADRLGLPAGQLPALIHPAASLSNSTVIGPGCLVLAGVVATAQVRLGRPRGGHATGRPHPRRRARGPRDPGLGCPPGRWGASGHRGLSRSRRPGSRRRDRGRVGVGRDGRRRAGGRAPRRGVGGCSCTSAGRGGLCGRHITRLWRQRMTVADRPDSTSRSTSRSSTSPASTTRSPTRSSTASAP